MGSITPNTVETFIVPDEVMVRRRVLPAGRYHGHHRGSIWEIVLSDDERREFGYRRPSLNVTELVSEGYVLTERPSA
ncbi:hypothetical protein NDN16_10965 [Aureimonas altamirensis]|uniref:hypothetical protein n=1 Tax=Aureimonas altamirensis TaxID=370622 RepID=UPI0020367E03|nr:hypothetical protein [Aureimonas altamirensis]MCM2504193.1 hypothetical protein [Aureimonas altamirensis]